jgi:hypothetical protein
MSRMGTFREWCARYADVVHAAFFFACFVGASIAGTHDLPLLSDNQHYFFIAERAASGVPPHISQFDPKNALGILIPAGAIRIGRLAGIDDLVAVRMISIAAGALAVALIWPLARRLTGSATAAWIGSAAMLALHRFVLMAAMGAQPKVFLVLFVAASLFLVSMRRWFLAGLAAGATFLCWQPGAALIVAGALALPLGGAGRRATVSFLVAATATLVCYEAYFVYHGILAEQLAQAFWFPMEYMEKRPIAPRPILRRAFWVLGSSQGWTVWSAVPLLFLVWLAVVWSGWWRRSSIVARAMRARPDRIYFTLGAHAALANCLLSFQGFPDRFFLDPFMAVAAGWIVARPLDRLEIASFGTKCRRLVPGAMMLGLAGLAISGHWNYRDVDGLSQQRKLGAAVGKLLEGGLGVYAVGCTHLLAFNRADNFTPYGFFFRGVADFLQVTSGGQTYRPLRDGKMPDVILVSRGSYLKDQPWFEEEYARAKTEVPGNSAVQVWLRVRRGKDGFNRDSPVTSAASP